MGEGVKGEDSLVRMLSSSPCYTPRRPVGGEGGVTRLVQLHLLRLQEAKRRGSGGRGGIGFQILKEYCRY